MKYLKFPTKLHDGEVHSVTINRDDTKLATGGRDNRVHIWNYTELVAVVSQPDPQTITNIQPTITFNYHNNVVSIIQWSPNNSSTFISADIDGQIFINDLDTEKHRQIYPFQDKQPCKIVDLTWSLDARLVAFSTTDGIVHILDIIKNTHQELSTLIHLEKLTIQRSLAFDPLNNYLITLGDDTLIYLYQYSYDSNHDNYQFRLINKIARLINKNPLNVNYKRISWSPEGELVSVPTASKNQVSLISLISRSNNWQNKVSLVGHGLNCEVVKFNPIIYQLDNNVYYIIATAGADKTLSVWNSTKDTPIFVLQDIVNSAILDLTWNNQGNTLIIASHDGYLSIVLFETNELGTEVTPQIKDELIKLAKDHVKPLTYKYESDQPAGNRRSNNVAIELLDQKDAESMDQPQTNGIIIEPTTNGDNGIVKETNGEPSDPIHTKGLITPEVIDQPELTTESSDLLRSAMTTRSTIKPTKQKAKTTPVVDKQKVTTKNGKRRIQPMLISNNGTNNVSNTITSSSTTTSTTNNNNNNNNNNNSTNTTTTKSLMDFDKASYVVSNEFYRDNKRLKTQEDATGNSKKLKRELEPVKFIGNPILNPNTTFSKVRLAIPKIRFNFQISSKSESSTFILDVKNGTGNETRPSRITYFKKDKEVWCDFIPRYIQLASEGNKFWAISTADGQILVYAHTSGKRIFPPLILGSPISFLESHSQYLLAVTALGELYVWNIELKKVELQTQLTPLLELSNRYLDDGLSKSDSITLCAVTASGIPLVTLSNGSGYLYNKNLGIWQTVSESWWSFGSHYWDSNDETIKPQSTNLFNTEASIIELLEHKTNEEVIRKTRTGRGKYFNKISKNMLMKEGFESLENAISVSHLENRILCSELLGEFKDFHKYFLMYVQRICELGLKAKLVDVCNELLGPEGEDDSESKSKSTESIDKSWQPVICSFEKHDLLKQVIIACSKHRDAQRILVHFGEKIGLISEDL